MSAIQSTLQKMSLSLGSVANEVFHAMDICSDGALRKSSSITVQGRNSSIGDTKSSIVQAHKSRLAGGQRKSREDSITTTPVLEVASVGRAVDNCSGAMTATEQKTRYFEYLSLHNVVLHMNSCRLYCI